MDQRLERRRSVRLSRGVSVNSWILAGVEGKGPQAVCVNNELGGERENSDI